MNFEAGFLSDNAYGVKHINRLVRSLITAGIVDYPFAEDEGDIGSYNINGFIQFLSEDGVIPETYKSMLVEKTDTGYLLNPGMAFLNNGIYIFIEDIQEFNCEPLMKVYWMHNTLTDKVEFMCAAEYPSSGSYLPLAEILEDGTVSNVRKRARAKLPGMSSDYNRSKKISVEEDVLMDTKYGTYNYYYGTTNVDLGGNNYKYLLFLGKETTQPWALVDLEAGSILNTYHFSTSSDYKTQMVKMTAPFRLSYDITQTGNSSKHYIIEILNISSDGLLNLQIADASMTSAITRTVKFDIYAF